MLVDVPEDLFRWIEQLGLGSALGVVFGWFCDWVHFDGLVLSSVELNINAFSLNNWLDVSLVDDLSSWSGDSLASAGVSDLSLSGDWVSVDDLSLRRNEVDFLGIVDNSSLKNWLGENFFGRCLEVSVNSLRVEFGWSGNDWIVDISVFSSLDV